MTPAQLTTLKTAINADATAAAFPQTSDGHFNLAAYLNTVPPTPMSIWRSDIKPEEISAAVVMADFVLLTAIKQTGLLLLTQGPANATITGVRTAFSSIFGAGPTLTALTALAQRPATRFEAIFSTVAAPANVSSMLGQRVSPLDLEQARAS